MTRRFARCFRLQSHRSPLSLSKNFHSLQRPSSSFALCNSSLVAPTSRTFCSQPATASKTDSSKNSNKSANAANGTEAVSDTNEGGQASKYKKIYLKDYRPPPYLVQKVDLEFDIYPGHTIVTNKMIIRNNEAFSKQLQGTIELDGDSSLQLEDIKINGLDCKYAILDDGKLSIEMDPSFVNLNGDIPVEIKTRIVPEENTSLEGLYKSKSMYCTQCEAQGFRKITFFFDRPDVTTKYTTKIVANAQDCPVLLSNGNPVDSGVVEGTDGAGARHYVVWEDPFAKPCYLFALVAGDLEYIESKYVTSPSGKEVILRIYTEGHNIQKCDWAMQSLIQSFEWDEKRFGLEYDLDRFNVVAVDDFNMGAMENKSLNIFNSKYVLANSDIATDVDYHNIQRVVGHEYFHNYTGNRVTCRDWFQLSLKEGLTVFRDQEFSSDLNIRSVERIDQVKMLQATQFKEDNGPMAHPVRPESYIEINNFYTVTVYEKGAEVVRMMQTVLGRDKFTQGVQHYLEKHDGEACTIEDFVNAMEYVSGMDLQQMYTWYQQAGTPEVNVKTEYNAENKTLKLYLNQTAPDTPDQAGKDKKPFLIPLNMALLKRDQTKGTSHYPLVMKPKSRDGPTERTLLFDSAEKEYTFYNIAKEPVLSINRNFSAPVYLRHGVASEDLAMLAANDSDPFNRWNAINKLYSLAIVDNYLNMASDASSDSSAKKEDSDRLNPILRECVKKMLHRFIPEKVAQEWEEEQRTMRRKDVLRMKRQDEYEKRKQHQFLNDEINNDTLSSSHALKADLDTEEFINDLIGEEQLPYQTHASSKQLQRDPLLTSRLLTLPAFDYLFPLLADMIQNGPDGTGGSGGQSCDPQVLVQCIENLRCEVGYQLYAQFLNTYTWCRDNLARMSLHPQFANNSYEGWTRGRQYRSLLNASLRYLNCDHPLRSQEQETQSKQILFEQYQLARNMTEMMGALEAIVHCRRPDIQDARQEILNHFYKHFESEQLVRQKWLTIQSTACHPNALNHVSDLLTHECYDASNPNNVYALVGGFAFGNPLNFHRSDGKGYQFLSEQVLYLDEKNASVAARMCKAFENVEKLDAHRQEYVANELSKILSKPSLSKGTFEVANRIVTGIEKKL